MNGPPLPDTDFQLQTWLVPSLLIVLHLLSAFGVMWCLRGRWVRGVFCFIALLGFCALDAWLLFPTFLQWTGQPHTVTNLSISYKLALEVHTGADILFAGFRWGLLLAAIVKGRGLVGRVLLLLANLLFILPDLYALDFLMAQMWGLELGLDYTATPGTAPVIWTLYPGLAPMLLYQVPALMVLLLALFFLKWKRR